MCRDEAVHDSLLDEVEAEIKRLKNKVRQLTKSLGHVVKDDGVMSASNSKSRLLHVSGR